LLLFGEALGWVMLLLPELLTWRLLGFMLRVLWISTLFPVWVSFTAVIKFLCLPTEASHVSRGCSLLVVFARRVFIRVSKSFVAKQFTLLRVVAFRFSCKLLLTLCCESCIPVFIFTPLHLLDLFILDPSVILVMVFLPLLVL